MKNVELKNYKTFKGHDGMRGINADIVYKGRKIASVYDDARGGCFEYNVIGKYDTKEYAENKVLFNELMAEVKQLPKEYHEGLKEHLAPNLDSVISDLCSNLDRKKDENKGILVKSNYGYEVIGFNVIIPTAIKRYSNALSELQKIYDEKVKANKVILNKEYLKSQGIKV